MRQNLNMSRKMHSSKICESWSWLETEAFLRKPWKFLIWVNEYESFEMISFWEKFYKLIVNNTDTKDHIFLLHY
jgi:hypothetical protein